MYSHDKDKLYNYIKALMGLSYGQHICHLYPQFHIHGLQPLVPISSFLSGFPAVNSLLVLGRIEADFCIEIFKDTTYMFNIINATLQITSVSHSQYILFFVEGYVLIGHVG